MTEMVNHPAHYNDTEIETMEMFLLLYHDRPEVIKGALLFNIFKYRDRQGKKESNTLEQDTNKMNWYLDKLVSLFPEDVSLYQIYHTMKES